MNRRSIEKAGMIAVLAMVSDYLKTFVMTFVGGMIPYAFIIEVFDIALIIIVAFLLARILILEECAPEEYAKIWLTAVAGVSVISFAITVMLSANKSMKDGIAGLLISMPLAIVLSKGYIDFGEIKRMQEENRKSIVAGIAALTICFGGSLAYFVVTGYPYQGGMPLAIAIAIVMALLIFDKNSQATAFIKGGSILGAFGIIFTVYAFIYRLMEKNYLDRLYEEKLSCGYKGIYDYLSLMSGTTGDDVDFYLFYSLIFAFVIVVLLKHVDTTLPQNRR